MKKEPVSIIGDGMVLGAGVGAALGVAFGYALNEKRKHDESENK